MSAVAVAIATPVGAVVGLGTGWLSLLLERVEGLEGEEREDRESYERDLAGAALKATEAGEEPPVADAWAAERYGWTWIERVLSPLVGAAGYAAFTAHEPVDSGLFIHLVWITVFVQIVDDSLGATVASASTMEPDLRSFDGDKTAKARKVGELLAERAKSAGVEAVVFDRGGNQYHGRVAALADGAREGGLSL